MLPPQAHLLETLWGNDGARRLVPRLLAQGRLPHALLLTGPDGIGKRSLALAMAKAILSAGMPLASSKLIVPRSGMSKRKPSEPPPDDDLFGADEAAPAAEEAAEVDLFGGFDEPSTPPPTPSVAAKSFAPAPPAERPLPPLRNASAEAPAPRQQPAFRGYEERLCRLFEQSYPIEYDKDGRATNLTLMDLTIIEPIGLRRGILVDQIRSLQEIASTRPMEGAYRVVLLFGADSITQEGANSILKLLEEPPPYLIMILTANHEHRVLPTIRSRCSTIPMGPMERVKLVDCLVEKEKLSRDLALVAATLAEGRPGTALTLAKTDMLTRRREIFDARLEIDRYGRCATAASAARIATGSPLGDSLWLLLSLCRDRLVAGAVPDADKLLVHRDLIDLVRTGSPDLEDLDLEVDRILAAIASLQHPYIPNSKVVLQKALMPEG